FWSVTMRYWRVTKAFLPFLASPVAPSTVKRPFLTASGDFFMITPDSLPLVAILRGVTPDDVLVHMAELYRAGFTQVEIPLNSPSWQQSIVLAVKHYGDRMRIGAGTVTTPREVAILKEAGCEFILTPNTDI